MIETNFDSSLSMNAVWRTTRDEAAFRRAIERTLPANLCEEAQTCIMQWEEYRATPLQRLPSLADKLGLAALYCKDEGTRFDLGSFKALGGAYAVARAVADSDKPITVACATEGNHGRSVAWGAQRAGAKCVIFLHENVSPAREAAIVKYGARIVRILGTYDDAVRECARISKENGWEIISDTTWKGYEEIPTQIMAGYSVLANEVHASLDEAPTHVFLQAGVGGMAAALMACISRAWPNQDIQFIIVEPSSAACLFASMQAGGESRSVGGPFDTITAGLACGEPSVAVVDLLYQGSKMMLALDDQAIIRAMRQFARPVGADPKIISGASGAAGMAALLTALETPVLRQELVLDDESCVLLINTENDTDPRAYQAVVETTPNRTT